MTKQTTVALELDEFYAPGNAFKKLLMLGRAMKQIVGASGVYLHCNFVFSPKTTADDAAHFEQNPQRTHWIRDTHHDEFINRGCEAAAQFVVIRQVRPGARFICAIPDDSVLPGDELGLSPDWYDDDDVMLLLFEFLCKMPGKPFAPHKLLAAAAELKWKRGAPRKAS